MEPRPSARAHARTLGTEQQAWTHANVHQLVRVADGESSPEGRGKDERASGRGRERGRPT
eukprot:scaffold118925_cov30-Tisochrysis_lutea.AAC.1